LSFWASSDVTWTDKGEPQRSRKRKGGGPRRGKNERKWRGKSQEPSHMKETFQKFFGVLEGKKKRLKNLKQNQGASPCLKSLVLLKIAKFYERQKAEKVGKRERNSYQKDLEGKTLSRKKDKSVLKSRSPFGQGGVRLKLK